MSDDSRFQSLTVLGKRDIFLVSISEYDRSHCIIFNMMKEAITWQKQKQKIQILGLIENP
jgi:hypothetical protein